MYKEKMIQIFKSPAIADIFRWSRSGHLSMIWICIFNLILSGNSLVITLLTKGLIDGATSHNAGQVKAYALIMITTILVTRLCSAANSILNAKTSAILLKDMRSMVLRRLLRKQYASLQTRILHHRQ